MSKTFFTVHRTTIYRLILILIYLISLLLLIIKIISPTNIQIVVYGEHEVYTKELTNFYSLNDVIIIMLSTILMTSSGILLIIPFKVKRNIVERTIDTSNVLNILNKSEKKIYDIIVKMGGIAFQSEIVRKSGLSRSTVSIILDKLEARGILIKRRKGMYNIVVLR